MTPGAPSAPFVAGVILAAGASTRMGRPKQLLALGGRPLLQHVLDAARASRLDEIVLVLGAAEQDVRAVVDWPADDARLAIVSNPAFASGQSGSLACGLAAVDPRADAAAVLLGDEPGVGAALIDHVLAAFAAAGRPAARPVYTGRDGRPVPGHPVVLARSLFAELAGCAGDAGAGPLLREHPERVFEIALSGEPPPDLDTQADYESLQRRREEWTSRVLRSRAR